MQQPVDGLRVIDLSEGPFGGLATMILADFGADVIKIEPPGGDPYRSDAAAPLWLRGKRSRMLDLDRDMDRSALHALAGAADVIVVSASPQQSAVRGCDYQTLAAANPALVYCQLSAFGTRGPYAHYAPYEAVVMAKAGRMLQFQGLPERDGPVYAALRVATHAASQSAVSGILAALIARERTGRGQQLETSLLRGLLPYEQTGVIARQIMRQRGQEQPARSARPARAMPTLNYHPVQAGDGRWLQLGNLLPHLFQSFLRVTGLDADYAAIGRTDRPAQWPEDLREGFRDRLLVRMQEKPLADWIDAFVADGGVAAHAYQSTQEALDDADIVANGHVIHHGGGRQLGFVAALTMTPGRVQRPAPAPGEHTDAAFGHVPAAASTGATAPRANAGGPLAGVTVVEAAAIIAAPQGASLLADLGARVIKLEPPDGDPFRNMAPGGAARQNTGKEYLALDLKNPEAQQIARRVIASADVFIHNYRPGVPERLGIGYAALAQANPRLVYISANGYGPNGPGALRPSTHPIPGAALGGVYYQIGGAPQPHLMPLPEVRATARRLMQANEVNPDPNTSVVVATAALLGVHAARRNGAGQQIFTDMFGANAYANFDDFLSYPGKQERQLPDREGYGLHARWRLYPCSEGWVFLGVGATREWDAFVEVTGFPGAHSAGREDAALADALGKLFAQRTADDWERMLAPLGIGCVRADAALVHGFLFDDPQAAVEELLVEADHPEWGRYQRHGAMVRFSETHCVLRGPGTLGQHTDALLAEHGYDADDIARLRAAGVVR
jgi:crotonobetainyl-CoA:carnitine CoA-transferase CaiB-like acyl-CoA transferase